MRRRSTGPQQNNKKLNLKTENRLPNNNLLERYYYEYSIQNVSCPDGELFVIDRQPKVTRLSPLSGKSNPKQQIGKSIKKKFNPAALLKSKKEKTRNEKN